MTPCRGMRDLQVERRREECTDGSAYCETICVGDGLDRLGLDDFMLHTSMSTRLYHLSCHCQRNIATVESTVPETLPEHGHILTEAEFCNCSFCVKRLIAWHKFAKDAVQVVKGCNAEDGSSKIYTMNRLQNTVSLTQIHR